MKAHARVILPNRTQMEFRASDLESLLPEGHRARLVWSYVAGQDLAPHDGPPRMARTTCIRPSLFLIERNRQNYA